MDSLNFEIIYIGREINSTKFESWLSFEPVSETIRIEVEAISPLLIHKALSEAILKITDNRNLEIASVVVENKEPLDFNFDIKVKAWNCEIYYLY